MRNPKTLRTREAGRLVEQVLYQRIEPSDSERVRSGKRKHTTEIMQRYNDKSSVRKFEMMLAANFRRGDIVGCVTYDDEHLPETEAQARRRFAYFVRKLKAYYKSRGVELVYAFRLENKHGAGRYHHHFVIPATGGNDYAAIRAAWNYGTDIELKPLRVDAEKNYATLARYMTKESREKLGQKLWSFSRNAKKPREDWENVEASCQLQAPKGVQVLERVDHETPFGSFQYIKYLLPEGRAFRPYRRRRRRKP